MTIEVPALQRLIYQRRRGAAVAAVYVLTAASGESHCIERIYLGADQARGFAQAYNRIAPGGPVQATDGMK